MSPYYADDAITLYHGDCRELLAEMPDRSVDAVITDPPYSEHTHRNATTNAETGAFHRAVTFEAIDRPTLWAVLADCGRVTRRWVIATLDYRHAFDMHDDPPSGLRLLRVGVWTKPNPTPQLSGDRPGQGWEAIAFLHVDDTKPRWNGGGRSSVWHHPTSKGEGHPTAKPLGMVGDWVRLFTDPGDTVLDPFAGSGTTLRAAVDNGRKAIGCELDERYCELIVKRMGQTALDFGGAA